MRACACYRDKLNGRGGEDIQAKCRIALLGCNDPDLYDIERYAPTATTTALHLLQIAAYNQTAAGGAWQVVTGDVSNAFLQGKSQKRTLPL